MVREQRYNGVDSRPPTTEPVVSPVSEEEAQTTRSPPPAYQPTPATPPRSATTKTTASSASRSPVSPVTPRGADASFSPVSPLAGTMRGAAAGGVSPTAIGRLDGRLAERAPPVPLRRKFSFEE